MWSINWNGQELQQYGLLLYSHRISLSRGVESIQVQDRAWSTKGKGEPAVITLQAYIVGISREQALSNYSTIRGLLDQEDECILKIDQYTDRYWMAQFNSMTDPVFVGKAAIQATIIMTCYDRTSFDNNTYSQTETLETNISDDYGGTIRAIAFDDDGDYIYIAGGTTNKVYKLSSIDLTKIDEGPDYGGEIFTICAPTGDYIYYGGNGGAGQYDAVKLDKETMAVEVRGPDYGGIIYGLCEYGNFIYYGGNGGAGQYDISKLLKSDMTTELRSADLGGIIYCAAVNSTHVFVGHTDGGATNHVSRYLVTDLSYVDQSDDYGDIIRAVCLNLTTCFWCGDLDEVWYAPVGTLTGETQSADLGSDLNGICVDEDYIYVVGDDNVVFKLAIAFAAGASQLAISTDYGGDLNAIAIDKEYQYLCIGGATTQTAWKIDVRHLEIVNTISGDYGTMYAIDIDASYIYTASDSQRVYKFRRSDCVEIAKSIDFGSNCYALTCDDDYVYVALAMGYIYKLLSADLSVVSVYTGAATSNCLCNDTDYIYSAEGSGFVRKITKSTMALALSSPDYTNTISWVCEYGNYIYYGGGADGAGHRHIKKLLKTDMATIIESADYGSLIRAVDTDGTYVYFGGDGGILRKLTVAALAFVADYNAYPNDIMGVRCDGGDVFITGSDETWKFDTSLNVIAKGVSSDGISLTSDDAYVYGCTASAVWKMDKRVLWVRSDHEITVTNNGSSRCEPHIGIIANGDNYWQQAIQCEEDDRTFYWEGSQADGEELEIDSELWYVTLEGVSAMAGVTGQFLRLLPGDNTIILENVVGEFIIDWRPRYA